MGRVRADSRVEHVDLPAVQWKCVDFAHVISIIYMGVAFRVYPKVSKETHPFISAILGLSLSKNKKAHFEHV